MSEPSSMLCAVVTTLAEATTPVDTYVPRSARTLTTPTTAPSVALQEVTGKWVLVGSPTRGASARLSQPVARAMARIAANASHFLRRRNATAAPFPSIMR